MGRGWREDREHTEYLRKTIRQREAPYGEDEVFYGKTGLTGRPTLKVVRYLTDSELDEALSSDLLTLSGRPVAEAARGEIERRKALPPS